MVRNIIVHVFHLVTNYTGEDRDFNPLQSSRPPKAAESSAGPKALQSSWPKAKSSAASEASERIYI